MFSHGPMSGARGSQRSYLVHILICKRCKTWGQGAMAPWLPLDPLLIDLYIKFPWKNLTNATTYTITQEVKNPWCTVFPVKTNWMLKKGI